MTAEMSRKGGQLGGIHISTTQHNEDYELNKLRLLVIYCV